VQLHSGRVQLQPELTAHLQLQLWLTPHLFFLLLHLAA